MSNENTIHKHELHVVFEEDENAVITWSIEADEPIKQTLDLSARNSPKAAHRWLRWASRSSINCWPSNSLSWHSTRLITTAGGTSSSTSRMPGKMNPRS